MRIGPGYPAGPIPDSQTPATKSDASVTALLELSDERDRWLRRVLASWREGYRAGRAGGYEAGWLACVAELKRTEQAQYRDLKHRAAIWAKHNVWGRP
jgi:hypothetical protein